MERKVGTISRGIRCPIIREGDDLVEITVNSVLEAAASEGYEIRNRDVVALTESIVARAQGNYASVDAIAKDVKEKLGGETVGVIFPILERTACCNRRRLGQCGGRGYSFCKRSENNGIYKRQ